MRLFIALLAGGLFGAGLYISGMTDTRKVQGWLDILGDWDPTLAFVLGGAIIPMALAWRLAKGRQHSVLGSPLPAPSSPILDGKLVLGSALFGAGWGLSGLCPGPAIASLSFGGWQGLLFFVSMIAAMAGLPTLRKLWTRRQEVSI